MLLALSPLARAPWPFGVRLQSEPIEVTLGMFGEYYTKDVLGSPGGDDHANIRAALAGGWPAVRFPNGIALSLHDATYDLEVPVGDLLADAEVMEGASDGWDPMSDCWIP